MWPDSLTGAKRSVDVSLDLWLNRKEGHKGAEGKGQSHINRLFHLQRCVSVCVCVSFLMEEAVRWGVVKGMAEP